MFQDVGAAIRRDAALETDGNVFERAIVDDCRNVLLIEIISAVVVVVNMLRKAFVIIPGITVTKPPKRARSQENIIKSSPEVNHIDVKNLYEVSMKLAGYLRLQKDFDPIMRVALLTFKLLILRSS